MGIATRGYGQAGSSAFEIAQGSFVTCTILLIVVRLLCFSARPCIGAKVTCVWPVSPCFACFLLPISDG